MPDAWPDPGSGGRLGKAPDITNDSTMARSVLRGRDALTERASVVEMGVPGAAPAAEMFDEHLTDLPVESA